MCFIIDRTIEMLTLNNFSVEIHGMIFVFKKTVSCIGIKVILGLGSSLQRLSFQTWQRLESDVRLIFWKCIRTNAILRSRWLLGTIRLREATCIASRVHFCIHTQSITYRNSNRFLCLWHKCCPDAGHCLLYLRVGIILIPGHHKHKVTESLIHWHLLDDGLC